MNARHAVRIAIVMSACVALLCGRPAWSANASSIEEIIKEVPTFHCLGVRCIVRGDDNRNATVRMEYRAKGSEEWKRALDLFAVNTDVVLGEAVKTKVTVPAGCRLFAGSVFDLDENTDYELRLTLTDPDGGNAEKIFSMRTWGEPQPPKGGRALYVVPGDGGGSGTKADPFKGLAAALDVVKAGDTVLLSKGMFVGPFTVKTSGTEAAPILIGGAGQKETLLDGKGTGRAVTLPGTSHVMFEDLAIQNATYGMVAHGSSSVTLRRCLFTKIESGFTSTQEPSRRHAIVDCTFEGPSTWPRTKGIEGTEAVQVIGEGHVIAWNRIHGFADAISIHHAPGHAIDFHNNDISECTDDGIEMDFGGQNTRCFRNRLTNCFQGISVQPLYGGPCYIFRNAMYNVPVEAFKIHNSPSGCLMFHNTCVKTGAALQAGTPAPARDLVFRNNLFIGTKGPYAMAFSIPMIDCDFDYDGYGGGPWDMFAKWNDGRYKTLAELKEKGPIEKHGVLVDPVKAFASGLLPPDDARKQFAPSVNDLRLKAGSEAVDAGVPLPNINDGYRGKAPDLGAYELGQSLPQYGPRPAKR